MSKKTVTCQEALDAVRAEDGVVVDAAERLECSPRTIYRRANEDDRIWEALRQERESLVSEMRQRAKDLARTAKSERLRWDGIMKLLSVFDDDHGPDAGRYGTHSQKQPSSGSAGGYVTMRGDGASGDADTAAWPIQCNLRSTEAWRGSVASAATLRHPPFPWHV